MAIIVFGAVVFNKRLTGLNVVGILLALVGVLTYNLLSARNTKHAVF